jgi:hypothetical protein
VRGLVHNACNRLIGQFESGRTIDAGVSARCREYLRRASSEAAA